MGRPTGKNGASATVATPPNTAALRPCGVRKCGASIAINNTGNAASKPKSLGSMFVPTKAPRKVPAHQLEYKMVPEIQKARRRSSGSASAVTMAVVSSITHWAPHHCATRECPRNTGAIARPYTALRPANNSAPPNALPTLPPAAMTETADICDAPVNMSSDMAVA